MTTPTTQPDRCEQIAREKYYQTGDTCPCCGIGTYLTSGVCDHCDIHRDSEYAAHRRSRILKHENQQPKSEPSRECKQIGKDIASGNFGNEELPYEIPHNLQATLARRIAAALQAKQDEINELRYKLKASQPTSPQQQTPHQ